MQAISARLEIKRLTRQFNGACVVDDVSPLLGWIGRTAARSGLMARLCATAASVCPPSNGALA